MNFFQKLFARYLHVIEIEQSKMLQSLFWGILALSIFDFNSISFTSISFYGNDACWPYLSNCDQIFPLGLLPESYFYTGLMGVVLGFHILSGLLAFKGHWRGAILLLLTILTWKALFHFVIRDTGIQNFEYFMLIPAFVFIFSKNKINSMRFVWACLYFCAASVKFY